MLAQSAADKLFEMGVAIRKQKKERLVKLEEEAAAKAAEAGASTPPKPETDNDVVDAMISIVDYPSTAKEALAFSQYGHTVNCFFEIYQVQENVDGTAPPDLKQCKEVPLSEEEEEAKHF